MCPTKLNTSPSDKQPLLPVIQHRGNLAPQMTSQGHGGGGGKALWEENEEYLFFFCCNKALKSFPV